MFATNKEKKIFFITTPIFYPNGKPHFGHVYTMIISDIIVRDKRRLGYTVFFQTGSDDHGEKIEKTAKIQNVSPNELIEENVEIFKKIWKKLNISEHLFFRTSNNEHKKKVREIFKKFLEDKKIYLGNYEGKYCIICEDFIIGENNFCINCNSPSLEYKKEEAYFLKIKENKNLLDEIYLEKKIIFPKNLQNQITKSFLGEDVRDLCITRKNLDWGIKVIDNNNNKFTIYVWFEALCNYINSDIGKKCFSLPENKCEIIQIMGKDIVRFHGIYWLMILKFMNLNIPTKIIAHGWVMNKGEKMSKSKNNSIDPNNLIDKYGEDVIRTYLIAKINFPEDGIINEKLLNDFYINFFVNGLGNTISRIIKMIKIYNNSKIPIFLKNKTNSEFENYIKDCEETIKEYCFQSNLNDYHKAFFFIERLLQKINKFIEKLKIWEINKEEEKKNSLNLLINGIKIIAFLIYPIAPETHNKIMKIINKNKKTITIHNLLDLDLISNEEIFFSEHLFKKI